MANRMFPQPGEDNDSANFGQWLHEYNGSEYVVDGMSISSTDGFSTIDIAAGKARLTKNQYTATQSGEIRSHGVQFVVSMDSDTLNATGSSTDQVYVEPNFDGSFDATPTYEVYGDDSNASSNGLKIASVVPNTNNVYEYNRRPDGRFDRVDANRIDAENQLNVPDEYDSNTNDEGDLRFDDGSNSIEFYADGSWRDLTEADKLDGYDASQFLRSDTFDSNPNGIGMKYLGLTNEEFNDLPNQEGNIGYDNSEGLRYYHNGNWERIYTSDFQQYAVDGSPILTESDESGLRVEHADSATNADQVDGIQGSEILTDEQASYREIVQRAPNGIFPKTRIENEGEKAVHSFNLDNKRIYIWYANVMIHDTSQDPPNPDGALGVNLQLRKDTGEEVNRVKDEAYGNPIMTYGGQYAEIWMVNTLSSAAHVSAHYGYTIE